MWHLGHKEENRMQHPNLAVKSVFLRTEMEQSFLENVTFITQRLVE